MRPVCWLLLFALCCWANAARRTEQSQSILTPIVGDVEMMNWHAPVVAAEIESTKRALLQQSQSQPPTTPTNPSPNPTPSSPPTSPTPAPPATPPTTTDSASTGSAAPAEKSVVDDPKFDKVREQVDAMLQKAENSLSTTYGGRYHTKIALLKPVIADAISTQCKDFSKEEDLCKELVDVYNSAQFGGAQPPVDVFVPPGKPDLIKQFLEIIRERARQAEEKRRKEEEERKKKEEEERKKREEEERKKKEAEENARKEEEERKKKEEEERRKAEEEAKRKREEGDRLAAEYQKMVAEYEANLAKENAAKEIEYEADLRLKNITAEEEAKKKTVQANVGVHLNLNYHVVTDNPQDLQTFKSDFRRTVAKLLGVPEARVVINNVKNGSVNVEFAILEPEDQNYVQTRTSDERMSEMHNLAGRFVQLAQDPKSDLYSSPILSTVDQNKIKVEVVQRGAAPSAHGSPNLLLALFLLFFSALLASLWTR